MVWVAFSASVSIPYYWLPAFSWYDSVCACRACHISLACRAKLCSVLSLLTQPHPSHCTGGQPCVWVLQSVLAPHFLRVGQSHVHGKPAPRALHFPWMGPSCSILPGPHSLGGAAGTVNVTLLENRFFADVITLLKILRWDHPGLTRWVMCPCKRQKRRLQKKRETWRERNLWRQKQTETTLLRGRGRKGSPLEPSEGASLASWFWASGCRQLCENKFVLSHPVCSNLYSSPRKLMQCLNEKLSQMFLFFAPAKGVLTLQPSPKHVRCYAWTEVNSHFTIPPGSSQSLEWIQPMRISTPSRGGARHPRVHSFSILSDLAVNGSSLWNALSVRLLLILLGMRVARAEWASGLEFPVVCIFNHLGVTTLSIRAPFPWLPANVVRVVSSPDVMWLCTLWHEMETASTVIAKLVS